MPIHLYWLSSDFMCFNMQGIIAGKVFSSCFLIFKSKKCISDPLRFGPADSDGNGVIPYPGRHSWLQLFLC